MAEVAFIMGTKMWKWGEGTGGRGDYAHKGQEVRGCYLCWENPVVQRQKIRPVHKETEVSYHSGISLENNWQCEFEHITFFL